MKKKTSNNGRRQLTTVETAPLRPVVQLWLQVTHNTSWPSPGEVDQGGSKPETASANLQKSGSLVGKSKDKASSWLWVLNTAVRAAA